MKYEILFLNEFIPYNKKKLINYSVNIYSTKNYDILMIFECTYNYFTYQFDKLMKKK